MRLLITGGCGFLGSNLAAEALRRGDELALFDDLSRTGSAENLAWLRGLGEPLFVRGDVSVAEEVSRCVASFAPDAVFHLAGQVTMTLSLADPRRDFEINALGSLNVLEAVRAHRPDAPVLYSSTNKVYGDLDRYSYRETPTRWECVERPAGFDEDTPLDFRTPYGCSKGCADMYMLDYARRYGLGTVVFRHSSMYGGRQFATCDQGWVGWFAARAVEAARGGEEPFTISGDGKQVRDILHADDMVSLYFSALAAIDRTRGQAFNVGGGAENSLSLLELFALLERLTGASLRYTRLPARASDQRVFIADAAKARRVFGWEPRVEKLEGLARMLEWVGRGLPG